MTSPQAPQNADADLTHRLQARQPLLWLNPALAPAGRVLPGLVATHAIGLADIEAADACCGAGGRRSPGCFPSSRPATA